MARSTYYHNIERLGAPDKYADLRVIITKIYYRHKKRYGYPRITAELHNMGICINHKTVQKLMNEMGLKAMRKRRHYNSYKGEVGKIAPNLIDRNFHADRPYQKWATDISQVNIHDKLLYISPILDMYNGEIVAYSLANRPSLKLVLNSVNKAMRKVSIPPKGLILHSDQGWHYRVSTYSKLLAHYHIMQSMSRKGNCLDNAMMENFFGLMKNELLYSQEWETIEAFEAALKEYIKYYNNDRIKSRLNGKSPVQYRTLHQINNYLPSNFLG